MDSVKSQPKEGGRRPREPVHPLRRPSRAAWLFGLLAAAITLALTTHSVAQLQLFGPAARRVKSKVELDPRLPSGAWRQATLALNLPLERDCSETLPLCVAFGGSAARLRASSKSNHAAPTPSTLGRALAALEVAYRQLVYVARLPAPERSWEPMYGSPAVTWVLDGPSSSRSPNQEGQHGYRAAEAGDIGAVARSLSTASLRIELQPVIHGPFESASVVCRSGVVDVDQALDLERDAFLCIGEAIAARLDAAEPSRSRRAYAEALWWQFGHPNVSDMAELGRVVAAPQRASVGRDEVEDAASTALLFAFLEQTLGTRTPYGLVTGLFALSAQARLVGSNPRYLNEPDWLDVLRESLGDDHSDFADRINAFGVARARLGATDGPLGHLAWVGQMARLQPDWVLGVSSLPRRVASKRPLGPLGMVAVRIEIDVPTKDLALAVHVEWEPPAQFTWTALKLDAEEHPIGRLDLAFEPRVTEAEKRFMALDGTRALLVVGTNLGGIDATHLLDPDHAPFEPHGCTVYVVRI